MQVLAKRTAVTRQVAPQKSARLPLEHSLVLSPAELLGDTATA